jgi:hypothetical protein
MPTVADCLEQAKFLVGKGCGHEAATLVLPRLAAEKRKANKEKRTRVQFDCSPEDYARFHEQLQRYREVCGNVTLAHQLMVDMLAGVPDSTIRQIMEAGR